ncbi:hypothetical protein U27_02553 [Candidatus Vecturithrix granuli]|uniref:Uncharacterized protein n=1 Tax=Vecturithrix granuli TaxID=1499967 RepID=A0A081CAW9_VECG1|nr:hypothetical protein U27_02553 [Candidatus Vecturithrix granuli]
MADAQRFGQECGAVVATASPMPRLSGRCPDAMTSSPSWELSSVPGTHHLQFNHYRPQEWIFQDVASKFLKILLDVDMNDNAIVIATIMRLRISRVFAHSNDVMAEFFSE